MTPPTRHLLMLVDDQAHNSRLLRAQLGHEHFDFLVAQSGEEALALLASQLPDLIILDFMMPGMNGQQVALELKKSPRTRNILIILLTTLSDQQSRMQALSAGVEEFINKPVGKAEL